MTMRGFNALVEGHKMAILEQDRMNWMLGAYVQSAVTVAVERNLAGQKSKSKYLEKPILQEAEEQRKQENLTEEEKKKQTEQFFLRLRVMESNFKLSKGQ